MTADLRRVRDAAKMRSALETPKTASGEVRIDASRFDTNHALFFDRFKIKPGPSFFELHFGFYGFARETTRRLDCDCVSAGSGGTKGKFAAIPEAHWASARAH